MVVNLLSKSLKDEAILQFLEDHQAGPVVYDFDRLREGTADSYWAEARGAGYALRFNEHQVLRTVHCYVMPLDGFSPCDVAALGVQIYETRDEVERVAKARGFRVVTGEANIPALSLQTKWARIEDEHSWVHYEFRDGALSMVNLSLPRP